MCGFPWELQVTVSSTRALAVWKIRDFSKMYAATKIYLKSQKFEFLKGMWSLEMYSFPSPFSNGGGFSLNLRRVSSTVESQNVKFKFFCRDKFTDEYMANEYVEKFNENTECGPPSYIEREDLLDGELRDLLLAEDTLTVCCEVRDADAGEPEDPKTDSEGVTESLINEQKVILEAVATVYEETLFPDVTLRVGGEDLPAHKAILSSLSSVFRGMFESDMKESREQVTEIQEMEAQTARQMLRYVYTGKVCDLEDESAKSLYVAADRYDLKGLKARCQQYLLRNVSVDNVCQLALLADLHSDEELKSAVRLFIRKNHQMVLKSVTWKESAAEKPAFFLELISLVLMELGVASKKW